MRTCDRITWIYFFGVKPQPLCVNEAVKANDHIEQPDSGFLAGHPVGLAVYVLTAVLALVAHGRLVSKEYATKRQLFTQVERA
jgi:hypothetical protein